MADWADEKAELMHAELHGSKSGPCCSITTWLANALREAEARGVERAANVVMEFVHTRTDCEAGTTTQEIADLIRARAGTVGKDENR